MLCYPISVALKKRSIQRTQVGRFSRAEVRGIVEAVHVLEMPTGAWEVRTLGVKGKKREFEGKTLALKHAFHVKDNVKVFVHEREPKKISLALPVKTSGSFSFREVAPA